VSEISETVIHGARIRLHPNSAQAAQFEVWRRRCRSLWNLLLGIEQAAYSGQRFRPELKWRQKWLDVVLETYEKLKTAHESGKRKAAPEAITEARRAGILGQGRAAGEPKLFLWEDELLKVMARLKQEPLGQWIVEIHSHAAQQVAKDVVKAIKTMLSEKKKGAAGREVGFPRFKKASAYAEGSVYFANTQIKIDREARRIGFPLGVGEMPHGDFGHIPAGATLMGGRIFREGETWWLAAQFQFGVPEPLPKTGRECGLKIAASIIATTVDNRAVVRQVRTPREPERHAFQMNLASKSLSRRKRGTKAYYKQAAKLAYRHARNRNVRDDCLHKTSRSIANMHDAVCVQKMDVKELMRKNPEMPGAKQLRKSNRGAAMSRFRTLVEYKTKEGGRLYQETPAQQAIVQECCACGKLHYMPLSKRKMVCDCGNKMDRQENAARNELENLSRVKLFAAE
jgi:putative transposase